ncbi:MAG: integrase arm-type DNA-binding domain-containing protein [Pseudomonadota bacterium]
MPALNKLSAKTVDNAAIGKHGDGGGLWFHKRPDGGGQWFLRVTVHGRRREMGLGAYPDITLAMAREAATKWRRIAKQGVDPIKERERLAREAAREHPTLQQVFEECFEVRKAQLKHDGKPGRWDGPVRNHVLPKLGRVPIEEIDQRDIRATLAPIWHEKADTALKAMSRLGIVIKHGAAMGLDVDLQAVDKARALLGKQRHVVQNVPSMPWQDVPEFYQSLGEGVTELALRFLILTGCRSSEVRGCHINEIDFSTAVWEIPGERMKGGTSHRVPLSSEALRVLELAAPFERDGMVFPGTKPGKPLSDMTWTALFKRRKIDARPHGFRSSLRTWLAETTDAPREVAEACLAHVNAGKVEAAYRRTDFLERRRALMERWGGHCLGGVAGVIRFQNTVN